ncbi:MAG: heavy-metal-associated domain-containing protein [Beijerinckiaceae bacterium]|jgi:copper chaperone CopZ|nr:heavy-metal-associated domain-containing protein [Beijerinckiaceae bacterium]
MSTILSVSNIHCGACAARVTKAIQKVEPAAVPVVDVATGRVTIDTAADIASIIAALDKAGYPASLAQ